MQEALSSKMYQYTYDAARLLESLRQEADAAKYGPVIQALFAHVILRFGGEVLEINHPGHPDIRAVLGGLHYNIEVETTTRKTLPRQLEQRDLDVLLVNREEDRGYYCVLDFGPPVSWLCVNLAALGKRANGSLRVSLLRSYSDRDFSTDCTLEFSKLVVAQGRALYWLSYKQLRDEALNSQGR